MTEDSGSPSFLSLAILERSRALVGEPGYRLFAVTVATVYAVISMVTGGMLTIFYPPVQISSFWTVYPSGGPWWDYPALLAEGPTFSLVLPFLPTVLMVLVSVGVGIGMTVALLLAIRLVRQRTRGQAGPAAMSGAAGLTPAMIALVTLGACCSTTAAATAGVAGVAAASGTTVDNLLVNNWYLGVFQLGILWVGLFAQEQLLVVYGVVFGLGPDLGVASPPRRARGAWGSTRHAILRFALLAGGVTWGLAVLADWTTQSPFSASSVQWAGWILTHGVVAGVAIVLALHPPSLRSILLPKERAVGTVALRALLVGAGTLLLIGVPSAWWGPGLPGLLTELLAFVGASGTAGWVGPPVGGAALAFRWLFQLVLLGSVSIGLGLRPAPILRWGVGEGPDAAPGAPSGSLAGTNAAPAAARPATSVAEATAGTMGGTTAPAQR